MLPAVLSAGVDTAPGLVTTAAQGGVAGGVISEDLAPVLVVLPS